MPQNTSDIIVTILMSYSTKDMVFPSK